MGAERLTVRGKLMAASATIAHALLPGTPGFRANLAWPAVRSLTDRKPGRALDPDYSLIERCLRGEDAAWEEMVKTHTRRVYSLCYRFTGKDSEAQDLAQEVFLRVFRTLKTFRTGEGTFVVWLSRLTRNLLIDNYRRNRLEQAALAKLSPELRETVILRDIEELEYREIAQVLKVPEGTVKSRLNRGRAELARILRKQRILI
jgi:RNA polymerase sigma-70 factor (ECF subfamily)